MTECAGSLTGCFAAHVQLATSLGNQRYCYGGGGTPGKRKRRGSRKPGQRPAGRPGDWSAVSPFICSAAHLLVSSLGPAIPSGLSKNPLYLQVRQAAGALGLSERKGQTPEVPTFPGLREQKGCSEMLSGSAEMLTYPWPGLERSSLRLPRSRWRERVAGSSTGPPHQPGGSSFVPKWELACFDLYRIQHTFDFKQIRNGGDPRPQSWTGTPGR